MARPRRTIQEMQCNADLPVTLVEELQEFCEATRLPRKRVIELALRKLLNERREATIGSPKL